MPASVTVQVDCSRLYFGLNGSSRDLGLACESVCVAMGVISSTSVSLSVVTPVPVRLIASAVCAASGAAISDLVASMLLHAEYGEKWRRLERLQ